MLGDNGRLQYLESSHLHLRTHGRDTIYRPSVNSNTLTRSAARDDFTLVGTLTDYMSKFFMIGGAVRGNQNWRDDMSHIPVKTGASFANARRNASKLMTTWTNSKQGRRS